MRLFYPVQTMRRQPPAEALGGQDGCAPRRCAETGFSLIELLVVLAIGTVLTVIAVPLTINAMNNYRLSAATSAATGAIQAARYAAVMHGYPGTGVPGYSYEVTFYPGPNNYQVFSMIPPATTFAAQIASGTATVPTSPIQIARPGDVTISLPGVTGTAPAPITFQFSAGGMVTSNNMQFLICNSIGTNTITVTGVGNVSVSFSAAPSPCQE